MTTNATTDWRRLALELAERADELVKATKAVQRGWGMAPLAGGMLHANTERVEEVLRRVREVAR